MSVEKPHSVHQGLSEVVWYIEALQDNPDLEGRVVHLHNLHREVHPGTSGIETTVESPVRAEIVGGHTDYNAGLVLAAAISTRSTIFALSPRGDGEVHVYSDGYSKKPVVLSLDSLRAGLELAQQPELRWTDYLRSVLHHLPVDDDDLVGADVTIMSNAPTTGGVSTSASLEVGFGMGMLSLSGIEVNPLELANSCQVAENAMGIPCGQLDQWSVALSEEGKFLLLDFQSDSYEAVEVDLGDNSFVIAVDPRIKRNLGDSGYPARRRACENSLPIWSGILEREVASLRELSPDEFGRHRGAFVQRAEEGGLDGEMIVRRVRHVVFENARVEEAVNALGVGDIARFGRVLTASGESALGFYDLDEGTPELSHLLSSSLEVDGVIGARNMGGGFSAVILALVENGEFDSFQVSLQDKYRQEFQGDLDYIQFSPSQGARVLRL